MKTSLGIVNTDQINKYNHKLTISAMDYSVWATCENGVPTNIGHNIHNLIGWSKAVGLYFTPGLTYTIGQFFFAETDEEDKQIRNLGNNYYNKCLTNSIEPYENDFKKLLGNYYSADGNFHYIVCAAYIKKEISFNVFPKLKELSEKEKNGLIYLSELLESFKYMGQGVFKDKKSDFLIFADPSFRKAFSRFNSFNFEFLDAIVELQKLTNVDIRISIDRDMIGYAPSLLESIEYEYWWGPAYSDDIANIKEGLAHYESDESEKLFNNTIRTEFYWKH
nr:hypothetical protein [Candidatus Kapabacteria bacterium]